MSLNLVNFEMKTREAVQIFWKNREDAKQKQITIGNFDQGERSGVTAGKNMDGFLNLFTDIIIGNGLEDAEIFNNSRLSVLPGYFRNAKSWDLQAIFKGELIAAIELKSHIGPSLWK
jgi:type II restriction enzyme